MTNLKLTYIKYLLSVCLVATTWGVQAQNTTDSSTAAGIKDVPLYYHSGQAQAYRIRNYKPYYINEVASNDTIVLTLPFRDDFAYTGPLPDTSLWVDRGGVLINDRFAVQQPTIGAALFDGINERGEPYRAGDDEVGYADSLISHTIDMSAVTINDPAVMSFYWQPGSAIPQAVPNSGDSLILKFMRPDSTWQTVWSQNGNIALDFYREAFFVADSFYHDRFRFMFLNYGRLSGSFDVWTIDYVYIATNRFILPDNQTDLEDKVIVEKPGSILKRYSSMPKGQFQVGINEYLADSMYAVIGNLSNSLQPANMRFIAFADSAQSLGPDTLMNVSGSDDIEGTLNSLRPFPQERRRLISVATDSINKDTLIKYAENPFKMDYYFAYELTTGFDQGRQNDTARGQTIIDDYYAYDDGTAEKIRKFPDSQLAYEFKLSKPDTLTGIDINLPLTLKRNQGEPFKIMIWKSLGDGVSTADTLLYSGNAAVVHTDGNKFHYYITNRQVIIEDFVFYVGMDFTKEVGIGCDINYKAPGYTFINKGSGWLPVVSDSNALMIRPVFDKKNARTGLFSVKTERVHINVYPNPVASGQPVQLEAEARRVRLINLAGQIIWQQDLPVSLSRHTLSFPALKPGLYLLETTTKEHLKAFNKLIIR